MTAADERVLHAVSNDWLREFVEHALPCRELIVAVTRAEIRRLERSIREINKSTPDAQMDATSNIDLGIALMTAALRGLDANDADNGAWSGLDGHERPLPRPNRAPLRRRLRYAWRAARTSWRAT